MRILALVIFLLAGCATHDGADDALLFNGMGDYGLKVSTNEALAQQYFDQGLALCHGYNHDEAARSFTRAATIDPRCAMAYWGQAYALGPNYNLWDEGEAYAKRAHEALVRARELMSDATELERGLIAALSTRFGQPHPKDRAALNQAYVIAMRKLWKEHPDHAEVGFLYADSLLCQHPWDQWEVNGSPKRDTLEIASVLERVLEIDVNHPGANHLYIHTMEASHTPERAEPAADRLAGLMPGVGHMVHMPSHIYMRIGRYDDSVAANAKAAILDRDFFAATGTQESTGIYHGYHLHNHHFLIWSAMFQGRYEDALAQCDELMKDMPQAMRPAAGMADWFTTKFHVRIRFGRWAEILESTRPATEQPYAQAIWHYARGIAFANTGRFAGARKEAAAFEAEAKKVPGDEFIHVVAAKDVLEVARQMLAGEIAFKAGDSEAAFVALRAAVAAESALRYTEPNPWMMPTRHALGALLLQEGKVAEAESCYRDDLKRYPGNGWSLHGLAECLERRGATAEAAQAKAEFEASWSSATVAIHASCFCRTR